jgi:hypothetical protein
MEIYMVFAVGPGLAAEFVNGQPVDKPVAQRWLFCEMDRLSPSFDAWIAPRHADSPFHLAMGIPVGK